MQEQDDNAFDTSAITQLQVGWGLWRDTCDWDRLRACYTPDAHMLTTWFDGPASAFIDASQRMAAGGKGSLQHYISTPVIRLKGNRAISVTRVQLLVRGEMDGVAVDATCLGRFHDRMVRQDGAWRIQRRVPVYEKDRVEPVYAGVKLSFDAAWLARFPAHYCHLAYMQSRSGATITMTLPAPMSDAERQLIQDDHDWLHSNSTGDKK